MSDSRGSKSTLGSSPLERGLGLMVSEDLKREEHVTTIVNEANRLLEFLKRTFVFEPLFNILQRPFLFGGI